MTTGEAYSLDVLGIRCATDKSRLRQDYLRQYQRMFAPFRDQPITLLEIGVHQGASLRMWEQFFPLAQIIALDIEPTTKRFERDRIMVEIGSQFDAAFLEEIGRKYRPAIIIDDGSHIPDHQIFSFQHLFASVAPGGVYIVEDISRGAGDPAAGYFSKLSIQILQNVERNDMARTEAFPGAFAIWKTAAPDDLDGNFEALIDEARRADRKSELMFYMAEYLRRHDRIPQAHEMACEASALDPTNFWIKFEIALNLVRSGSKDEAIALMLKTAAEQPLPTILQTRIAEWQARGT